MLKEEDRKEVLDVLREHAINEQNRIAEEHKGLYVVVGILFLMAAFGPVVKFLRVLDNFFRTGL